MAYDPMFPVIIAINSRVELKIEHPPQISWWCFSIFPMKIVIVWRIHLWTQSLFTHEFPFFAANSWLWLNRFPVGCTSHDIECISSVSTEKITRNGPPEPTLRSRVDLWTASPLETAPFLQLQPPARRMGVSGNFAMENMGRLEMSYPFNGDGP